MKNIFNYSIYIVEKGLKFPFEDVDFEKASLENITKILKNFKKDDLQNTIKDLPLKEIFKFCIASGIVSRLYGKLYAKGLVNDEEFDAAVKLREALSLIATLNNMIERYYIYKNPLKILKNKKIFDNILNNIDKETKEIFDLFYNLEIQSNASMITREMSYALEELLNESNFGEMFQKFWNLGKLNRCYRTLDSHFNKKIDRFEFVGYMTNVGITNLIYYLIDDLNTIVTYMLNSNTEFYKK